MDQQFNLRDVVRGVLHETDLTDPGDVAGAVLVRIPARKSREALSQALRQYVRVVIGQTRMDHPAEPDTAGPSKPRYHSWKVAGIRDYWDDWQRQLRQRMHGAGEWKMLGDFTYEDLIAAAAERRALAERNAAAADQFQRWADLLIEYDVTRFGDLPADVQASALRRAA